MPIFEVRLDREQYQVVYVEAGDQDQAVEAGWELAEERHWMEVDTHDETHEVTHMPEGQRYWSGGEGGAWVEP